MQIRISLLQRIFSPLCLWQDEKCSHALYKRSLPTLAVGIFGNRKQISLSKFWHQKFRVIETNGCVCVLFQKAFTVISRWFPRGDNKFHSFWHLFVSSKEGRIYFGALARKHRTDGEKYGALRSWNNDL